MKAKMLVAISLVTAIIMSVLVSVARADPFAEYQATNSLYLPIIFKNAVYGPDGLGNIGGKVFNTTPNSQGNWPAIEGATVCIKDTTNCKITGADGLYSFQGLSAGSYQFVAQHPDYYPLDPIVEIKKDQTTTYNFGMAALLALGSVDMRITVEWVNQEHWPGSNCPGYPFGCPTDLDAHLWVVNSAGPLHIFQDQPNSCLVDPGVCLEYYSSNGPGPESIAIRKIVDPSAVIYYGVRNVNQDYNAPDIRKTGAIVRLYQLDAVNKYTQYDVVLAPAAQVGDFWYVFSIDAAGVVSVKNCITTIMADPNIPPQCPTQ